MRCRYFRKADDNHTGTLNGLSQETLGIRSLGSRHIAVEVGVAAPRLLGDRTAFRGSVLLESELFEVEHRLDLCERCAVDPPGAEHAL